MLPSALFNGKQPVLKRPEVEYNAAGKANGLPSTADRASTSNGISVAEKTVKTRNTIIVGAFVAIIAFYAIWGD